MAGSGGAPNRFVTFSEVMLGPPGWFSDGPDSEGWLRYYLDSNESSSITITRSDGKVLSFDVHGGAVWIRDNVIRFFSGPGESSGEPFK